MTDLPPPRTPAGWYPDGVPGSERWWDGAAWTERTRAESAAATRTGPLVVRGTTGYAELDGALLLYRTKPDRPPTQRIDLATVQALVVSGKRTAFDVVFEGAKGRKRPSLLSETSLQRSSRTSTDEWEAFLDALERAIAAAVPKFAPPVEGSPSKR